METLVSRDLIRYLGKICEWLDSCPDGKRSYGEFYPNRIPIHFDGDLVATFLNDDPDWLVQLA